MARSDSSRLLVGAGIAAMAVGLPVIIAMPYVVGADAWVHLFPWSNPRWSVLSWAPVDIDGPALLVVQRTEYGEDSSADRVVALSLATGDVLGAYTTFSSLELAGLRPGRLWMRTSGDEIALRLPDLAYETTLDEVMTRFPEVEGPYRADWVDETDTVRLTTDAGFQWDVSPDLTKVVRLHHDTPVARTESMAASNSWCSREIPLPSGRIAMLGEHSDRPALKVATERGALEAIEVQTPHEGFHAGRFLCEQVGRPITRAPETVFIAHTERDDLLLSRVDQAGLAWTLHVRDLEPALQGEYPLELLLAVDQGDALTVWVRAVKYAGGTGPGHDLLLSVGVADGAVRWQTAF